ncbi:hypothetical protein NKH18_45365 [Streptomyces sp. M10(2022)]
MGPDKPDAWRGQAAGVFWDLIDQLEKQYSDYADDMRLANSTTSTQGDALRKAKDDFMNAVNTLHSSWVYWQKFEGNPCGGSMIC